MGIWGSGRPRRDPAVDDVRWDDALDFWQKEVHYYEGRAGEQGASANRVITVAAGATALVPVVGAALAKPVLVDGFDGQPWIDARVALYLVPAVILLLWATAIRLLHEMEILREYRYHAERQVARLARADPRLADYLPWEGLGTRYDAPQPVTAILMGLAATISLFGVAGVIGAVNRILWPIFDPAELIAWAIAGVLVAALGIALWFNKRDAANVAEKLRNPPRYKR